MLHVIHETEFFPEVPEFPPVQDFPGYYTGVDEDWIAEQTAQEISRFLSSDQHFAAKPQFWRNWHSYRPHVNVQGTPLSTPIFKNPRHGAQWPEVTSSNILSVPRRNNPGILPLPRQETKTRKQFEDGRRPTTPPIHHAHQESQPTNAQYDEEPPDTYHEDIIATYNNAAYYDNDDTQQHPNDTRPLLDRYDDDHYADDLKPPHSDLHEPHNAKPLPHPLSLLNPPPSSIGVRTRRKRFTLARFT
eukprot:GHVP01070926.1.p1 GENE.GHVP01070926.1~~GHVP01070926.1.p1  ORF type:complete len:245 (+),score=23.89 GHVP01070926.1:77-811(+)